MDKTRSLATRNPSPPPYFEDSAVQLGSIEDSGYAEKKVLEGLLLIVKVT